MCDPWWQSWSVEELSPLNPLAVVSVQLSPPNWEETWYQRPTVAQNSQLWWLCWYARPDLRENQIDFAPEWSMSQPIRIHPETLAEWAKSPTWPAGATSSVEWQLRRLVLRHYPLTKEQCQRIHAATWTPVSLGFQAAQSEAHGSVLLEQIRKMDDVSELVIALRRYVEVSHGLTGDCGEYLLARALTFAWPLWLAKALVEALHPFPEELLPCLLNSTDPQIREIGTMLSQQQK